MFEWIFGKKKEFDDLKSDIKNSFEHVREDINNVSKWVKHLNEQDSRQEFLISNFDARLSSIENDIDGIKNTISMMDAGIFKQLFKTNKRMFDKQTAVQAVQNGVQTPVQTAGIQDLSTFSLMERAIILVLLNSDMKLSYDDLAAMLGKSRATVRGQVNAIKQKSDSLIEEVIESNGKKRVFIPEEIKEKMLKNVKVRVGDKQKSKKAEK